MTKYIIVSKKCFFIHFNLRYNFSKNWKTSLLILTFCNKNRFLKTDFSQEKHIFPEKPVFSETRFVPVYLWWVTLFFGYWLKNIVFLKYSFETFQKLWVGNYNFNIIFKYNIKIYLTSRWKLRNHLNWKICIK